MPSPARCRMNLRPYQTKAIEAIKSAWANHPNVLLVMATGLGKTVTFVHLANTWSDGRVLILAHREELISQAADKVQAIMGPQFGIEMAQQRSDRDEMLGKPKVVISSVQTMCRDNRLSRFRSDDFGLVIVDEAHHAIARTYQKILDHYRDSKVLGVTATPRRGDEYALNQVFDHVAYDYGIEPAIKDGWLVPVKQKVVKVNGLDFSSVRTKAGDLTEIDLERILSEESHLHATASPTLELAGDGPTIVFCVTVHHATLLSEVINRYKPGASAILSGTTDREKRREVIESFKKGNLQILCNCMLFTEGFDAPNTANIVMARPTKSLSLYMQMLGRGTRPLPGVVDAFADGTPVDRRKAIATSDKPSMTVLDFVGNSGRHKIVSAVDALGGRYGEPVRQRAKQLLEGDGQGRDTDDVLDEAAEDLELWDEQKEFRRKIKASEVRYIINNVNPFSGDRQFTQEDSTAEMATSKQRGYLAHLGIPWRDSGHMTKRQASREIERIKRIRELKGID